MTLRHLGRSACGELARAMDYEWLVTNGIGGFASGTVCEINTRRYHGLLIASLAPPVSRTLMVAAMDVTVRYASIEYPLATHEFGDGTVVPHGYVHLESFHLDHGMPVWRYAMADAVLEKRLLMRPGYNTTHVSLQILRASEPLHLALTPLCTYRDYHRHGHGGWHPGLREIPNSCGIFDAEPPFAARRCFAQAWSVAEVLRA